MGYKSGMTHIIREVDKPGSKAHKKEVCEPVSVLETPPMIAIGVIGYVEGPNGLYTLNSVFARHLSEEVLRRFFKNWYSSTKRKSFVKKAQNFCSHNNKKHTSINSEFELNEMKNHARVIRVLCHSQVAKLPGLRSKKAHLIEIQVNGGSIGDKIKFSQNIIEKAIPVEAVLQANGMVDTIAITKGKGTKGVISRWGVTRLPRKTHRGLRKVACVGAWHPSAIRWTVARHGQKGRFHRTEINKKIYRLGKMGQNSTTSTNFDLTDLNLNPMGGFPRYGIVREDFIIIKGSVQGCVRQAITLRHSMTSSCSRTANESINLKFIDTSSKFGHRSLQNSVEKERVSIL
jgi:large subunit ribosomal protein L3e